MASEAISECIGGIRSHAAAVCYHHGALVTPLLNSLLQLHNSNSVNLSGSNEDVSVTSGSNMESNWATSQKGLGFRLIAYSERVFIKLEDLGVSWPL